MNSLLNTVPAFFENLDTIMDYAMLAACALLSFATAHANISKKVRSKLTHLICQAESEFQPWQKSGVLKHKWVIDKLHETLPAPFRPFFPKAKLEKLVGEVLDSVNEFIELQESDTSQTQTAPGAGQSANTYPPQDSYAGYFPEDGYAAQPTGYSAASYPMNVTGNTGVHYVGPGEYHVSAMPGSNPFK